MVSKSSSKLVLRRLARTLLILFILFNLILASHAWKFTHFYDDPELRKPQQQGFLSTAGFILMGNKIPKKLNDSIVSAPHTTVTLHTSDGLALEAWHIPCMGFWYDSLAALRSTLNFDHKGTIIMFHGHGSCKAALLNEAYAFLRMGYNVFMPDFRAHGNSEGEQCMIGIKETADVKAAYDYVSGTGERNILLYGSSMGAATVIRAVNELHLNPAKLILEMPFGSLMDATKGKLRIMHLPDFLAGPLVFWGGLLNGRWAFGYQPYLEAASIQCPVLLQWGAKDPRVTKHETDEIFAHISSDKKLVIYENAAHESLYKIDPPKWLHTLHDFLDQ